ncbi:MAG: phosphatase PAP2 family protein [Pirellulales bacterium]|nr:phosphatase PAP2 family protein [Pirellulales bacterium]
MTKFWCVATFLLLAGSVGCHVAEHPSEIAVWESPSVVAPSDSSSPRPPPRASIASVRATTFDVAEKIVTPATKGEIAGEPYADLPFEAIDSPAPNSMPAQTILADTPPCDFLDTLSPRARSFFDDGEEESDLISRWAIVRHLCHEDLCCEWQRVKQDYKHYYSCDSLGMLAIGVGLGAIAANTNIDYDLRDHYQIDSRSSTTDDFSRWAKVFGEGQYVVAAAATGWLAGEALYDRPAGDALGEWGGRTFRTLLVGTPPLLIFQHITGGPRPGESHAGSRWRPFHDNNGVSGHSFMGATPFINAAKMTDNIPLKLGCYACSFAPGWSRINDDAHFTSQVFLGWWMAYWAATAVDLTNRDEHSQWSVQTVSVGNGTTVGLVYTF